MGCAGAQAQAPRRDAERAMLARTSMMAPALSDSRQYATLWSAGTTCQGTGRSAWRTISRLPCQSLFCTAYGRVGVSVKTTASVPVGSARTPARSTATGQTAGREGLPSAGRGRILSNKYVSGRIALIAVGDQSDSNSELRGSADATRTSSWRSAGATVASHCSERALWGAS